MSFAYQRAAIALLSVTGALAADVNYQFNIVNANVAPDGFSRSAVTVNGGFPGTTITAIKGDRLIVWLFCCLGISDLKLFLRRSMRPTA